MGSFCADFLEAHLVGARPPRPNRPQRLGRPLPGWVWSAPNDAGDDMIPDTAFRRRMSVPDGLVASFGEHGADFRLEVWSGWRQAYRFVRDGLGGCDAGWPFEP